MKDFPFKNMRVTNGCYWASFAPLVFTCIDIKYSPLFILWFLLFDICIIIDTVCLKDLYEQANETNS